MGWVTIAGQIIVNSFAALQALPGAKSGERLSHIFGRPSGTYTFYKGSINLYMGIIYSVVYVSIVL